MADAPQTDAPESTVPDYKDTLFLPKTDFPMRAGLPKREPDWLAHWEKIGLYERQREQASGREPYELHDGPPYANGDLHLGHAVNKILKDIIIKSRTLDGYDAPYVPGWDCHGLPIEHKVMTELVEKGKAEKLNALDDDALWACLEEACRAGANTTQ